MIRAFFNGGIFSYIQICISLLIVWTVIKHSFRCFSKHAQAVPGGGAPIHGILFWGAMAMVIGFFAHFVGIFEAMESISRANDISPAIVAEGYQMALITIIMGIFIFIISAICWFVLKWRYGILQNNMQ
ncbi:MotA/TolQ/ExbB proton channel family protein [bacterium]|nr:MotA/TolQ/ExbB proton channel family protein [bacterium]